MQVIEGFLRSILAQWILTWRESDYKDLQHKESHHRIFHSHWFTQKKNSGKAFKEIYQQNEISNDSLVQESMNYGRYTVMLSYFRIVSRSNLILEYQSGCFKYYNKNNQALYW